jgi:hypothetical protein
VHNWNSTGTPLETPLGWGEGEHHTYSEDDVEEGEIKINKTNFFHENGNFCRAKVGKNIILF